MIEIEIPGLTAFRLHHLVMDVNGTIAKDGQIIPGVCELLDRLRPMLQLHLVTADTHGTQGKLDQLLEVTAVRIPLQDQARVKREYVEKLGAEKVVAVGNGANDSAMLECAALGIFVVGPEGSAVESMLRSKVIVPDILAGLELLIHPKRLMATLRR